MSGGSRAALPSVLSPSIILPPPASWCSFITAPEKFGARFKNLISVCLILLKPAKSETAGVSVTDWTAESLGLKINKQLKD